MTSTRNIEEFFKKLIECLVLKIVLKIFISQREKQQKLNELDVVVTLTLDQIQYVINKKLPRDLSQCLVFEQGNLDKLQVRIKELDKEKIKEKQIFK